MSTTLFSKRAGQGRAGQTIKFLGPAPKGKRLHIYAKDLGIKFWLELSGNHYCRSDRSI
jgi:hypothetical protein